MSDPVQSLSFHPKHVTDCTNPPMMKEIKTTTPIHAPSEQIWNVLTDLPALPEWNPCIDEISGKLEPDAPFVLKLNPVPINTRYLQSRLLSVTQNRELSWVSIYMGLDQVFGLKYQYKLVPKSRNRVTFIHGITFWGWLLPMYWNKIALHTLSSLKQMNNVLKHRMEEPAMLCLPEA